MPSRNFPTASFESRYRTAGAALLGVTRFLPLRCLVWYKCSEYPRRTPAEPHMPDQPPSPESPNSTVPAQPIAGSFPNLRVLTTDHADLVRAALIVVFVLLGLQLLWSARTLALTAFLGMLFGLGAVPAVDALERRGIRRGVGSPVIIFGVVALIVGLAAWSAPTLVTQSQDLRTRFPEAIQKAELWLANSQPRLLDLLTGTTESPARSPTAVPTADSGAGPIAEAQEHRGRIVTALYGQAD